MKYHPEEYNKRREEMRSALRKRCEVFSKLLDASRVSSVSLDLTQADDIVTLLNAGITELIIFRHFSVLCRLVFTARVTLIEKLHYFCGIMLHLLLCNNV